MSSISADALEPKVQQGVFYVRADFVEHGCCWDSAIVTRCELGKGIYGSDVNLVLECNKEDAQMICDALNAKTRGVR